MAGNPQLLFVAQERTAFDIYFEWEATDPEGTKHSISLIHWDFA
jgi:hypothetical protein